MSKRKQAKEMQVITVDVEQQKYVLKDMFGEEIKPDDFPHELHGTSYQLMKYQVKGL